MNNSAIQLQPGEDGAGGAPSGRNKLINGQFLIWQRGLVLPPPLVAPVGGQVGFASDRWSWQATSGGGTFNLADLGMARGDWADPGDPESFGIDGDPKHFMRFQSSLTGTDGSAATNLVQRIERVEHFNGRQATLSFWARTEGLVSPTGTIAVSILQFFGAGGSTPVTLPASVDIFLTTTWTYYTLTFDIPSVAGKTLAGSNDSLRVRFHNHIDAPIATLFGFVGPIAFTDVLNITNIQFELGTEASPFENRFDSEELALCQRYFNKNQDIDTVPSAVDGPGRIIFNTAFALGNETVFYPNHMRAIPTLVFFNTGVTGSLSSVTNIGEASAAVIFVSAPFAAWTFNYTADAEL